MIISDIKSWKSEKQAFHPVLNMALQWLADRDFSNMTTGRYDILPENRMFCLVQEPETGPFTSRQPESHFRYADVQYLIQGKEKMGVARLHPLTTPAEYRPEQDIVFYEKVINESVMTFDEGMFAVFFPDDIHRPCCEAEIPCKIRKAVIKIELELFNLENSENCLSKDE